MPAGSGHDAAHVVSSHMSTHVRRPPGGCSSYMFSHLVGSAACPARGEAAPDALW